jgi:ribose/xylose/arabinose/galactoside ABC-type transport system permease subunit
MQILSRRNEAERKEFVMGALRIIQRIAYVAGLGALAMAVVGGISQLDLSLASLLIGCAVILALLALSMMLLFIRGMRLLGIIGMVDALIVPVLLLQVLLFGPMHGLVQATYLLIALDVFGFTQATSRRYRRLMSAASETTHHRAS